MTGDRFTTVGPFALKPGLYDKTDPRFPFPLASRACLYVPRGDAERSPGSSEASGDTD